MNALALISICFVSTVFAAPSGKSIIDRIPSDHVHEWDLLVDKDGNTFLVDKNPLTADAAASNFWSPLSDTEFWLFTQKNPTEKQNLLLNNPSSIQNSNFKIGAPTLFIIHGWNSDGTQDTCTVIRDAVLVNNDWNVIIVDWSKGSNHLVYSISRYRIDDIADVTASFINFMQLLQHDVGNNIFTGHSLGAHAIGLIGKKFPKNTFSRMVALEPAGPLFDVNEPEKRIFKDDAAYVEIIHTNAGELGMSDAIGDSDFFPNWGFSQPGCGLDLTGACAHSRSYYYFAESFLGDTKFDATQCKDRDEMTGFIKRCTDQGHAYMGGASNAAKAPGVYFVPTKSESPYSES